MGLLVHSPSKFSLANILLWEVSFLLLLLTQGAFGEELKCYRSWIIYRGWPISILHTVGTSLSPTHLLLFYGTLVISRKMGSGPCLWQYIIDWIPSWPINLIGSVLNLTNLRSHLSSTFTLSNQGQPTRIPYHIVRTISRWIMFELLKYILQIPVISNS